MADYGQNIEQIGDMLVFSNNGLAELAQVAGQMVMTPGPESAIFLALQGGNEEDDGSSATESKQFWGNYGEPPEKQFRSRTLNILSSGVPINSGNVTNIVQAVVEDLGGTFPTAEIAISKVSLLTPKHVVISGSIVWPDKTSWPFEFHGVVQ